jgi:hypothetical protein
MVEFDAAEICPEADENDEMEPGAATSLKASQSIKKSMINNDDEDEETFESVLSNLPGDLKPLRECLNKAQGCCLLLVLKQFLKEIYSITDLYVFFC